VGIAIKFSETPGSLRSLPPEPGRDTKEILLEMGYTEGQIAEFKQKAVIS